MVNRWVLFILWVTTVVMVVLLINAALAHDHDHPELDGWFNGLRSGRGPCCSYVDGRSLEDPDWQTVSDENKSWVKFKVKVDGEWVDVTEDAVVQEPNKIGKAWVWPFKTIDGTIMIRCFMPGSMG